MANNQSKIFVENHFHCMYQDKYDLDHKVVVPRHTSTIPQLDNCETNRRLVL